MVENAKKISETETMRLPHSPGSACPNAEAVMIAASSRPMSHVPAVTMTRPVMVTTMMVSMKVWVIETSAWRAGCWVFAAAAAMAAEPMPDSLEKMPRATPNWMASMMPEPTKPPVAAVPVNASLKMVAMASGTRSAMSTSAVMPPPT